MIFFLSNRDSLGEIQGGGRWVDGFLISEGKPVRIGKHVQCLF